MIATLPAQEAHAGLTAEELVVPVADQIRRTAAEAEAIRRLPDDFMRLLKDAGLFSIYTPKEFGGLDLPLPQALRVVEEVSRHDGSTGWLVALGLANAVFPAFSTASWAWATAERQRLKSASCCASSRNPCASSRR